MKKPDRLFQVNRARRREDQGPKPRGPLGHPGTEYSALPETNHREVVPPAVSPADVDISLVRVTSEARHVAGVDDQPSGHETRDGLVVDGQVNRRVERQQPGYFKTRQSLLDLANLTRNHTIGGIPVGLEVEQGNGELALTTLLTSREERQLVGLEVWPELLTQCFNFELQTGHRFLPVEWEVATEPQADASRVERVEVIDESGGERGNLGLGETPATHLIPLFNLVGVLADRPPRDGRGSWSKRLGEGIEVDSREVSASQLLEELAVGEQVLHLVTIGISESVLEELACLMNGSGCRHDSPPFCR